MSRAADLPGPRRAGRWLRAISGTVAGGIVALALVLLAGWVLTTRTGSAGPGTGMLVGHGIAAVVVIVAQILADRRPDRVGAGAAAGVLVVGATVLSGYWLF